MEKLILMSIKTKYANQIFNGTKIYEYRRKSISKENLNKKIFIYSSEVDKKIVGYITIGEILEGTSNYILEKTSNQDNVDIMNYFKDCDKCYALKISSVIKFENPISLAGIRKEDEKFAIPQYYRYIKETEPLYQILKEDNYI